MISNLIGPRKWIFLAKELEVYPHEKFNSEINKLNAMYKKPPRRVWTCLTEWRLGAGSNANVMDLLIALRNIKIHWLAGMSLNKTISDERGYLNRLDMGIFTAIIVINHPRYADILLEKT